MIRAPRVPRPSRPVLLTILVTAVLAFPMGIVLASHQFGDVPNSNPFHADIDALVDSGVTAGCGGGNYCPKSAVTREQMAAFLNRLGALAPGKTPVVNATKVDGIDSANLLPGGFLPAGATVRGTYAVEYEAHAVGDRGISAIPFGYRLASAPAVHFILVGGAVPAGCSGTSLSPNAAPGHLCVFETFDDNTNFNCIASAATYSCGASNAFGATLFVTAAAAGQTSNVGTWAVTAPLGVAAGPEDTSPTCAAPPAC